MDPGDGTDQFSGREENRTTSQKTSIIWVQISFLNKQSIPSRAVKEIFFTQNDDFIFAILPQWPGEKLIIRNISVEDNTAITLLASNESCSFTKDGNNLVVELPDFNPNFPLENGYAYVLRIKK